MDGGMIAALVVGEPAIDDKEVAVGIVESDRAKAVGVVVEAALIEAGVGAEVVAVCVLAVDVAIDVKESVAEMWG